MINSHVDFLGKDGQMKGDLARHMANKKVDPSRMRPYIGKDGRTYVAAYTGGDPKSPSNYKAVPIQTNGTLRRDEWKRLDEAVLRISEERITGVQDLIDNNLTYDLGNGMGTTVLEWHDASDALVAELSMDGVRRAEGDRSKFTTNYLPLPIIHADYDINLRVLENSRKLGNPLDTTLAERATRKVMEMREEMLFTDTSYQFGGGTIYSYLNHPNRNAVVFQTNGAWDAGAKTAGDIREDVLHMKQTSIEAFHYGPWMVYIPTTYETILDDDYDVNGASLKTIRQRIMDIEGIRGVKVVDKLPDGNVLLVQMTSDVVRLVRGMGLQNVEWDAEGGMITHYKVMTIQVPQIRADQDGNSGIVHMTA